MNQTVSHKSNFLVSCLHTNTPLCLALGHQLKSRYGRNAFFISDDCPSSPLMPQGSLVLTAQSTHGRPQDLDTSEAHALFEYIHTRDRFLKKRLDKPATFKLLENWSRLIWDYLVSKDIQVVILEGTPAYELLLEFWARKHGAIVVCPAQIAWGKETGSVLYSESIWSNAYLLKDKDQMGTLDAAGTANAVFDCNDAYPGLLKRVRNFLAHRSLNAPTRQAQVVEAARKKLVGSALRHLNDDARLKDLKGDIVTYFLHVDPEKSVDNSGSDIWPQMNVIRDLRKKLPPTTTLVVRDHPLIRGKRKLTDVRAIRQLPNTRYVSGQCDRNTLMASSRFVSTISGSVALESAVRGATVLVYGRPIFLHHPHVFHVSEVQDFGDFGRQRRPVEQGNAAFGQYIEPRLAKFVFGDIHLMSTAMSEGNVANLAKALMDAEQLGWKI